MERDIETLHLENEFGETTTQAMVTPPEGRIRKRRELAIGSFRQSATFQV